MSPLDSLTLFIVMTLLALVPSTSVALVVTRSSTAGFANGACAAAGIVVGDLIFVFLAVLGLTALAEVMGGLFLILRYLSAGYLIWFGIGLLCSKSLMPRTVCDGPVATLSTSFFSGLVITLGDVKAIFFYASLFPSFVDLAVIEASDITVIIFLTLIAVGGVKLGYAYAARKVVSLSGRLNVAREAKLVTGGVLVGLGTYVMAKA